MYDSEFSAPFRAVTDYLDSKDISHTPFPKENRINLSVNGRNANYRFAVRLTNEGKAFQVISYYPFYVRDEKLRISSAELITRANYGMILGSFEMDMKDGMIQFHSTHVIVGGLLHEEIIERHFVNAYRTMDRYFPALMQHIHAGYTPEDAVFHAELDIHAESFMEEPKQSKNVRPIKRSDPTPPVGRQEEKPRSKSKGEGQGELPL